MKLSAIIIDDEPLARKVIREHIEDTDFLEFSGEAENPIKAMPLLNTGKIDLIFLDIQMPKLDGIGFIRSNKHLPAIIFTTAFPEYALDGYELDIIDFLIKPITYERFFKAATKAQDYLQMKLRAEAKTSEEFDYLFIKCDNRLEKINFDDILFIEGMSNYILIHTKEKKYLTYLTMRSIEEKLPKSKFVQIHRSYIVSIPKIDRLDVTDVWIRDKSLPISKGYKDALMQLINERTVKR